MKFILALIVIVPYLTNAQNIFATFTDRCIIWSDESHSGKKLTTADKGDSCIVIKFLPKTSGTDWFKVAVMDTVGYVMSTFINIEPNDLKVLRSTDYHAARESSAKIYVRENWTGLKSKKESNIKAREDSIRVAEKALDNKLKAMRKELSKVGLILNSQVVERNILGYPDFKVSIMNCSNKTIKYIWYNITLFNPVDDAVKSLTLEGVGPILPFASANYTFETVAVSKIVEYCKINSIKIQYMNGGLTTLTNTQITSNTRLGNAIIDKYAASLYKY